MLKVSNVRMGFANNSSSSHSILLCNAIKHGEVDKLIDDCLGEDEPYFGWESFVCASPEAKAKYFACQLGETLRYEMGSDIASLVVSGLFGVPYKYGKGTVDHQSHIAIPRDAEGHVAIKFIKELFDMAINDPRVVIGGGNDNSSHRPVKAKAKQHPWFPNDFIDCYDKLIAREEPYGWCLFNADTGTRVRLTRKGTKESLPNAPELVDICITKYCMKRCDFCYQNCDHNGKHGDKEWLSSLAYNLKELGVFEVVLGGGEPTDHPDFLYILEEFRRQRIVPNFTTASSGWLEKPEIVSAVVQNAGSVAFSCHNISDVEYFGRQILKAGKELTNKVVLQSIIGIVEPEELKKMLDLARAFGFEKYSFVGFKSTGRAPGKMPYKISKYNLKSLIKDSYMLHYADTSLLKLCPEIVEKYTCDVAEGKQSMYIDAVNKTMQESSYTGMPIAFKEGRSHVSQKELLEAFHIFQNKNI